jgi:hypothetical protein
VIAGEGPLREIVAAKGGRSRDRVAIDIGEGVSRRMTPAPLARWAPRPIDFELFGQSIFAYYFTDQDAMLYRQDPVRYLQIPVEQRLHYYLNHWSEPRFFRHSDDIVWTRSRPLFPR